MSRIVWSVGGTGVLLSCLAVAWLQRPLEPLPDARAPSPVVLPPTPVEPVAPPVALARVPETPPVAAEPEREPEPEPAAEAFLEAALKVQGPPQPELRDRARRALPETRLRLVKALRADHASPQARRDAVLAELLASGDSVEPWTRDAHAALDTWHERLPPEARPVQTEPARCYAAGCVSHVTFPDEASFRAAWERASSLAPSAHGAHLQLPPERLASGGVRVPWLVLRPDRS